MEYSFRFHSAAAEKPTGNLFLKKKFKKWISSNFWNFLKFFFSEHKIDVEVVYRNDAIEIEEFRTEMVI